MNKTYWKATLFLNDEHFGTVYFKSEKDADDFFAAYEKLTPDQKWGYALFEFSTEENEENEENDF